MKLLNFYIDYFTRYGEELYINIVDAAGAQDVLDSRKMATEDGRTWRLEMAAEEYGKERLAYFYSLKENGVTTREEWVNLLHTIDLASDSAKTYRIFDRWNDKPQAAFAYTQAFTECLAFRPRKSLPLNEFYKIVRIKVKAPQLHGSQRLQLVGKDHVLGAWNPEKALNMSENGINEWVVDIDANLLKANSMTFKFMLREANQEKTVVWETGENREIRLAELPAQTVASYELADAQFAIPPIRAAGTLMPVFSLRSQGSAGIGDFGDMISFIDWLSQTKQRIFQVLPINDTTRTRTWHDSYPYSCVSVFALHPIYIDLRKLPPIADPDKRLKLERERKRLNELHEIDYEKVLRLKETYLRTVFSQEYGREVMRGDAFKSFFKNAEKWLVPYAKYAFLRDETGTADFKKWGEDARWNEKDRKMLTDEKSKAYQDVAFYYFTQFILHTQLTQVHNYARNKGVVLKGDIPIGVSPEGCDVWQSPSYFNLHRQAGAPPDEFSAEGQNWKFPTYNWEEMAKDDYQWWRERLRRMALYFDAYRIDHVLGFFRIWDMSADLPLATLGQFTPSLPFSVDEIGNFGLKIDEKMVLHELENGEKSVVKAKNAGNVLFVCDSVKKELLHPRIQAQKTQIYQRLDASEKLFFNRLYNDFFYHRNNEFWSKKALEKLPRLVSATQMLVCAEDLGMVPSCVPEVLRSLDILSLEIQSMPKDPARRFGNLSENPYLSVTTISTHDMPTLRQWWDEDPQRAKAYAQTILGESGRPEHPLPASTARRIIELHLASPSMLCVIAFQDWLAMSESLRQKDDRGERVNIPSDPHHYWRYRMHIGIEKLLGSNDFNSEIGGMIAENR